MTEENMNPTTKGFIITETMKADLLSAAKWAKFLCIVACLVMVILAIIAISSLAIGNSIRLPIPGIAIGVGAYLIVIIAIWLFPIIKGFQFANSIKNACLGNDETELARGFEGMRAYLRIIGIYTIVLPTIFILIYFIAIATIASKFPGL